MRRILHILSRPDDELAREMIARQQEEPENEVIIIDLSQTDADYQKLLLEIFAADSVQSW